MIAIIAFYGSVLVVGLGLMARSALRERRRAAAAAQRMRIAPPADAPATLHPIIDQDRCMGSGGCVLACPERHALALIGGRAHLVDPRGCIGHGACRSACPMEAISLVFGSGRRGVDLPDLDASFQTSVPGLYIAGELGGMGLVANAVRQGVKAVEAIASSLDAADGEDGVPLVIVGAGPAGLGASLAARERGLGAMTLEQEHDIGGTVRTYPRGKIVMTQPVDLPLYGRVRLRRTTKEALIELWQEVIERSGVEVRFGVRVDGVKRDRGALVVTTSAGEIRARRVLLATGRRGQPRRLGVAGEGLEHVRSRLDDPGAHAGQRCVVVGGGDSAIEAALALAGQPATVVVLCHRGSSFDRCKRENLERLQDAERRGALQVLRETVVTEVLPDRVRLSTVGRGPAELPASVVFALLGTDLPAWLLRATGVAVSTHYGGTIDPKTSGQVVRSREPREGGQ